MSGKRNHSIRGKLTGIIMLTSTIAVLLAAAGFVASGVINVRARLADDLSMLAQVIASNSAAALTFEDRQAAAEALHALRAKPSIVDACIYTNRGEPFAHYAANGSTFVPPTLLPDGWHHRDGRLELFSAIQLDHERIGTLYIASDSRDLDARLKQYAVITSGIVLVSLLIAFFVASRLQRTISGPIVELARVATLVSRDKDFNLRAVHGPNVSEEIGNLLTGFNGMLAEIEQRDGQLLLHQSALEDTVALRTGELTTANEELVVAKDAAERVAEINAVLARETALILSSATEGILRVGLDNRATYINPAGVRILGWTLSELQGKSIHDAIHHSHPDGTPWPEAECERTQAMQLGTLVGVTTDTFWRADGTSFPVEYSFTPMVDEEGNKVGAVVMFHDVTERRAIERLKSEFVSTVSHELRTPLTSIRGALGLLSGGVLGAVSEKGQRMLEIAVSNTDRLVRLINNILDLERIESGKVELARGPVDANAAMVQASEGVQTMADQARVRLVVEPATGTLWGDSDRIIQTLTNLLGNAIKFSPPDTTVTLSGAVAESNFAFCVADQGRGIPEQKLTTIFERFSQVDSSDSRDKGGSGLGLAICQSIVQAHGGRIWVEKNEPAGSRFRFTIPLAVPATATDPATTSSAPEATLSDPNPGHSILIVEDDLDLARVMTAALEGHGIRTLHAVTGHEAVQLCMRHEPSLIVLDLVLPDMDGFAVVRALREQDNLARLPLLVYSALDVGSADQSRLHLGRTEFLTKSRCSLAEFEGHVVRLLATVTDGATGGRHAA